MSRSSFLFIFVVVYVEINSDCCCHCCNSCRCANVNLNPNQGSERMNYNPPIKKLKCIDKIDSQDYIELADKISKCKNNRDKIIAVMNYAFKNKKNYECPRTIIKWVSNNCTFASVLQYYICTNSAFVIFFYLLDKLEIIPFENYPIISELCKFVKKCVENPEFNPTNKVSCMGILKATCTYLEGDKMNLKVCYGKEKIMKECFMENKCYMETVNENGQKKQIKIIKKVIMDSNVIMAGFKSNFFFKDCFLPVLSYEFDSYVQEEYFMDRHMSNLFNQRQYYNVDFIRKEDKESIKRFRQIVREGRFTSLSTRRDIDVKALFVLVYEYHMYVCIYYPDEGKWYSYDDLKDAKVLTEDEMVRILNGIYNTEKYDEIHVYSRDSYFS